LLKTHLKCSQALILPGYLELIEGTLRQREFGQTTTHPDSFMELTQAQYYLCLAERVKAKVDGLLAL